jgi:outer membrane receptor protein involved in Fe transport
MAMNYRYSFDVVQLARFAAATLSTLICLPAIAQEAPAPSEAPEDEDVVVLSPFVVSTQRDQGYFAANTLAGSRMNTNIADLGASISVITKQEMEDTASTDINDVFRYQVNTEGSTSYTPATPAFRNDGFLDVSAGGTQGNSLSVFSNATANRVRGIGIPSSAINYYPSISQVPFDSYNIQSVEISRGPNSMLFGIGSPAGIVNQSTAQADVNKRNATVGVRFDDRGSFRGSLSFNHSLIDDKLGIYGAMVYDHRKFERKPSYDKTRRQYAAITYKPFPNTTIRANFENYRNDNRRPNTLTPRDFVTEWNLAGQPAYDPVNRQITVGGQVAGVYVTNASSPYAQTARDFIRSRPGYNPALRGTSATNFNGTDTNFSFYNGVAIFGQGALSTTAGFVAGQTASGNILFNPGIGFVSTGNQARPIMQIADGQLVNWFQPLYNRQYLTSWGTAAGPNVNPATFPALAAVWANSTWSDIFNRDYSQSAGWTGIGNGILSTVYRYPGVTDQSIYDWESVNVNAANFGLDRNRNINVEFEQRILDNLFFTAGWFGQDFDSATNYTIAQLNATTLFIDTNVNRVDGTPNPYFGKPYVEDFDPDQYVNQLVDDHYRAMLAWTPDFTHNDGWTRWLGRHQVLALWSKDESMATTFRRRLMFLESTSDAGKFRYLNNQNNMANGNPTGWNFQNTSQRRIYYLAAPGDPNGVVTRSSGEWNPITYAGDISVYDYANSQFNTVNMTTHFQTFDAGTGRNQRVVESISGGITSYLWDERLIATFGVRKDEYKARSTNTGLPRLLDAEGNEIAPAITNPQKWVNGIFQEDLLFNRWARWDELEGTTRTIGGVLRPFQKWASIENRAGNGSLWWQFIRDFGVSYNKSNNFNPPASAQGDFFGNQLPKPQGEGEDYGFQFTLFDNKLFARVTWFEASNENERFPSNPTANSRLELNLDTTLFRNWARTIAKINLGMDPTGPDFNLALPQAVEDQVQAAAATIWQQPYDYYASLPFGRNATRNADAEGVEAEVNYNPTRNWTMKFTFGKQDTKYSNVLKEYDAWFAVRNPIWQSAKASDYLLPAYQHLATYTRQGNNRPVDLTTFWTSYGYDDAARLDEPSGNTSVEAYYNINLNGQALFDRSLEGQSAPGQRKYRWSFLTSYTFSEGRLNGFSVGGAQRWEDKSVIGYLGQASGANLDPVTRAPLLDVGDISKPIYDSANYYTDLWIAYRRKIFDDKVGMTLRLNVNDVFESGGLQTVGVNFDGSPYAFRIEDPRQFILSATFDF